ncbi:MAG: hypothetical protein M3409_11150, partial [Gemmatimonadota bacterium]|nr:hypothetical protein [Gemmatimonadota bacterium]
MNFGRTFCPLLFLAAAAAATPARAQSLFSAQGLGMPVEPVDARARGLGGAVVGLPGGSLSLINPASVARLPAPALIVSIQPEWTRSSYLGRDVRTSTTRFPLIHAAAPLGERWAVSAGYGAFLDQNFGFERSDTVMFAGEEFAVRDRLVTDGGVARLRLGAAYALGERLALGLGLDVFTGSRTTTSSRNFFPTDTLRT